ncbi:hypothetical protein [Lacipirellula limnantheis]|uniref:Uncharacterized protein n=1 Tax=Lacipirellula limnantheis TaxID=2528024 RepID=A0A517TV33_9BACT|nr:hypothetical protein [Lacipirellula limnantheis]QDT72224.1 hypothetical protein I41_13950 [Lacipirellula limnantheis]
MVSHKAPPAKRDKVLVAIHSGGFLEAFAERNIDVVFARIPAATSLFGQQIAEDCFELLLPQRYRDLWRRDYLRASSSTAPLTAEAVMEALTTRDSIAALNSVNDAKGAA